MSNRTLLVKLLENYAGLRKGDIFRILDEGPDWVLISAGGKPLHIPSNLCE